LIAKTARGTDMARADWSRALPRPIVIPKVMKLATLGDVRTLIEKHLPPDFRDRPAWRHVAAELAKAAGGGDLAEASLALRMALSMAGVEWQAK
jgi:hypothetical protein